MAIRCKDLFYLKSLSKLTLAGGQAGLDRVIRWVYAAEVLPDSLSVMDWLYGGELLFVTGGGMQHDPRILCELVQKSYDKNLSAIIVFIGPYISEIPAEAAQTADRLGFPLFTLPWEVKLVEVTQEVCSSITMDQQRESSELSLMESLLYAEWKDPAALIQRAAYHGFDLARPFVVMIADMDHFSSYVLEKGGNDERRIIEVKHRFHQAVMQTLYHYRFKTLSFQQSDSETLLLRIEGEWEKEVHQLAAEIRRRVSEAIEGMTASIGISSGIHDLNRIRQGHREADQALKSAKKQPAGEGIFFYRRLGVIRLFNQIQDKREIQQFHQEYLGRLMDYDRLNHAALMETLEVYLRENGNMVRAAQVLYLHRNTMKYRLQKIEEVLGMTLHDSETQFLLRLALKIGQHLSIEGAD